MPLPALDLLLGTGTAALTVASRGDPVGIPMLA
jgi:hypothetical protein